MNFKIITGPRASGKTTRLIELAKRKSDVVVVNNIYAKKHFQSKYHDKRFATYEEIYRPALWSGMRPRVPIKLFIDDFQDIIYKGFEFAIPEMKIEAVTLGGNVEILSQNGTLPTSPRPTRRHDD